MKYRHYLLLAGIVAAAGGRVEAADNVILFIGDGMGPQHVRAGRAYVNGNTGTLLQFETLGYTAQEVTTLPGGGITDSATAATALATGYQHPSSGIISMGANHAIKTTLLELARARGMRTGIVTTDDIGGATPGAFGAHEPDRGLMAAIRADYLRFDTTYQHDASLPNVLLGGGHNDPATVAGTASTYVGLAQSLGYQFVSTSSALQTATAPNARLLGLFCAAWTPMTGMAYRSGNSTEPLLRQMLTRSLDLLQNPNGFFVMIESANIDKLSHSNDKNFVAEVAELNAAVAQAIAWKQNHPAERTLIFVTADHETGALNVPDQTIPPGTVPAMSFGSTGHSAVNVPAFATWPAGIQGVTLDNTETFFILQDFLNYSGGGQPPVITGLTVSEVTSAGATVQWTTAEPSSSVVELSDGAGTLTFTAPGRTTAHSVACTGLAPGTTYLVSARSIDLGGFAGTKETSFATTGGDPNAYVLTEPVVRRGSVSGTYQGVLAPGDGLRQNITETPDGVGSGVLAEYTLHTPEPVANIDSLTLDGAVSWTSADGSSEWVVIEIRVLGPAGSFGWQPILLPFVAAPPASYVDDSGNLVVRFRDSASISRERKDTLTVDYLAGTVVKGPEPPTTPCTPDDVTALSLISQDRKLTVTLGWLDCASELGYEVWRYSEPGGWAFLAAQAAGDVVYTDTTPLPATTYAYVVRAFNANAYADSTAVGVITPPMLVAPPNLVASTAKGAINLSWTDSNTDEDVYEVLRGTVPDNFDVTFTLNRDATSYADKSVVRGVSYYYRVRATKGGQPGPGSDMVSAKAR